MNYEEEQKIILLIFLETGSAKQEMEKENSEKGAVRERGTERSCRIDGSEMGFVDPQH